MAGATLGTAYIQIVPSAEGISGAITQQLGGEAQAAGTATGSKFGAFLKKAIGAAAVGATIKAVLSEGGKLQQSYFGGLDTLYGEAADGAREYARAAASAGISMNDYAEQAVSFGAALKSAYGGDVTKAAKAADRAIMDMADNSAKMGADINSVQMAYQGFAKQNYTMLDNLKLGYGGTKTEMERLLADAEKLTGVHYDIDNLGDVYEGIHVIQDNLGLTGVAAKEASETFSGSFNAMKASAMNFIGSLAIGEGVNDSLNQLMSSVSTFFFNNLIPMLGTIIKALPGAIVTFIRQGIPMLLSGISDVVKNIATSVVKFASNFSSEGVQKWATTMLPKILSTAGTLLGNFAKGLLQNIGKIVLAIGKIGLAIVKGLGSALWAKVTAAANGIKDRFMRPINALRDKVKAIIDKIKGFFKFKVSAPHIPLPHFSISPAGWKIADLLKGSKPSLSVKWYAQGGIMDTPTLFGMAGGEAGPEAILPLNPFWDKLDKVLNQRSESPIVINVYGAEGQSVKEIAQEVKRTLINEENRRRLAWQ